MTHDEAINLLFKQYKIADKKRYTDFFLSGLSDIKWNSGLYVYASMKTFPKHIFTERENNITSKCYAKWSEEQKCNHHRTMPCYICSTYREDISNKDKFFEHFFDTGLSSDDVYCRFFVLEYINNLEQIPNICEQDFEIFKVIITHLKNAEPEAKIRDIHKQLKKSDFFKELVSKVKLNHKQQGIALKGITYSVAEKIQYILETLGVCGILHTREHKAPFYNYINLAVAPRSSHSSDWKYPVDFWRGKDGIDWIAFEYWFGKYEELNNVANKHYLS